MSQKIFRQWVKKTKNIYNANIDNDHECDMAKLKRERYSEGNPLHQSKMPSRQCLDAMSLFYFNISFFKL